MEIPNHNNRVGIKAEVAVTTKSSGNHATTKVVTEVAIRAIRAIGALIVQGKIAKIPVLTGIRLPSIITWGIVARRQWFWARRKEWSATSAGSRAILNGIVPSWQPVVVELKAHVADRAGSHVRPPT